VQQLEIFNGSALYKYQGCFNETVDLPGTARERALPQGAHKVAEGTLTALDCLAFCATSNNGSTYKYAGIEYSRYVSRACRGRGGFQAVADAVVCAGSAGAETASRPSLSRGPTPSATRPATGTRPRPAAAR